MLFITYSEFWKIFYSTHLQNLNIYWWFYLFNYYSGVLNILWSLYLFSSYSACIQVSKYLLNTKHIQSIFRTAHALRTRSTNRQPQPATSKPLSIDHYPLSGSTLTAAAPSTARHIIHPQAAARRDVNLARPILHPMRFIARTTPWSVLSFLYPYTLPHKP